jgi:hypothetical protein
MDARTSRARLGAACRPVPTSEARNVSTFGILQMRLRATGYDWNFVPDTPGGFSDTGSASRH